MSEIERMYSPGIGRHWFDADTLRFFRCRLAQIGYQHVDGRVFFVSSEQQPRSMSGHTYPRLYTVRVLSGPGGSIKDVGGFQAFKTATTAAKYAQGYASGNISEAVAA